MRSCLINKKGQAVAEMAIFGSLILLIAASFLAYIQRANDQQYNQMESFRRALQKACTYQGATSGGAGGSVQYNLLENRRHSDVSGGHQQRSPQSFSATSSVFWAVPKVGEQPENLTVYKINQDEKQVDYRQYIPKDQDDSLELRFEDMTTGSEMSYNETATKKETVSSIENTSVSQLQENITTDIPYTIRAKDSDNNPDNDVIVSQGTFWAPVQGVYRDVDGQYKYSESAKDTVVTRGKKWTTPF